MESRDAREVVGVIDEYWARAVNALERIADFLEGTTDDDGLLHVLVREPEADEPDEAPDGD